MTIYARLRQGVGEYGVPGMPVWVPGEERPISNEQAAQLQRIPEFVLRYERGDGVFLGESGSPAYLGYFGPVDSTFGYGGGGISILRALSTQGIRAYVHPNYSRWAGAANQQDLPPDAASHLKNSFFPRWTLAHCLPDDLPRVRSPQTVMWTMWEMDRVPDGSRTEAPFGNWPKLINRGADHLVVPCAHNAVAFRESGVEVPITAIPYGLDTDIWPMLERPERDTFTFVLFGDLTDRKGPREAVAAFLRAFPDNPSVRLVLKSQHGHFGGGHRPGKPIINDPRVTLIDETWTRAQLLRFLYEADAFVWPSRGEGFGLPPVQALLTGLPVITTTHTGMAEWFSPKYAYPIASLPPSPGPLYGNWLDPDVDSIAEQMQRVYLDPKAARRKAKAGAAFLRKEFSIAAFGRRIAAFLNTLEG